jgi:cation diffusion facilitator family transporter
MTIATQQRAYHSHRVTLITSIVDFLLGVGKILFGVFSHSYGLVVDGIHSLSDLLSDFVILGVIKYSHHDADDEHPYGHLRFETMATLLLGVVLMAVAGILIFDNVERIIHNEVTRTPTWPALVAVTLSIIVKEWMYHFTKRIGEKIHSDMLIANAWHSRSDSLSSLVVMVGIIGSMFHVGWLDVMAAIVVAVIIAKIGWDFARASTAELVDTGLAESETKAIKATALNIPGVRDIHFIRGRRMGPHILLELHIEVNSNISVSEGHYIGCAVAYHVMQEHDDIADVTFHIDAEDDGFGDHQYALASQMPDRNTILKALADSWQHLSPVPVIRDITLHYLGGKIKVDVFISSHQLEKEHVDVYQQNLQQAAQHLPWLASLSVWYG